MSIIIIIIAQCQNALFLALASTVKPGKVVGVAKYSQYKDPLLKPVCIFTVLLYKQLRSG